MAPALTGNINKRVPLNADTAMTHTPVRMCHVPLVTAPWLYQTSRDFSSWHRPPVPSRMREMMTSCKCSQVYRVCNRVFKKKSWLNFVVLCYGFFPSITNVNCQLRIQKKTPIFYFDMKWYLCVICSRVSNNISYDSQVLKHKYLFVEGLHRKPLTVALMHNIQQLQGIRWIIFRALYYRKKLL